MNLWSEFQANEKREIAAVCHLTKPTIYALMLLAGVVLLSIDGNTRPAASQESLSPQFMTQMRACIHDAIAKAFPLHGFYWKRDDYSNDALLSCANITNPTVRNLDTAGDEAEFLLRTIGQEHQKIAGCWATKKPQTASKHPDYCK